MMFSWGLFHTDLVPLFAAQPMATTSTPSPTIPSPEETAGRPSLPAIFSIRYLETMTRKNLAFKLPFAVDMCWGKETATTS